jgi:protein TonB
LKRQYFARPMSQSKNAQFHWALSYDVGEMTAAPVSFGLFMSSSAISWFSKPDGSRSLRIGAAVAVAVVHAAALGGLLFSDDTKPVLPSLEPIMVSLIEAPAPEQPRADPAPTPPPPQQIVPPPAPPEPEVEPAPAPDSPPVEKPPKPAPKPKPKPKIQPKTRPPKQQVAQPPKPLEVPPPLPPSGTPQGATRSQAPQAPVSNEPITVSSIEYLGQKPMAIYPSMSARLHEQGRVVVMVDIDTRGEVSRVAIDSSSGVSRLDEAALAAARKARFKPLTRNGVAFAARARVPFDFVLRN